MTEKQIDSMEELAAEAQAGGKAITLRGGQAGSLIIDSDLWRFATGLVQGGMVPKGLNAHPGAVCAIIQAGAEIGFPPMHSLSALTFVNGRLGIMGEASRGLVRARHALKEGTVIKLTIEGDTAGKLADWPDDTAGVAWCWPKGSKEPVTERFTVGQARQAALWEKRGALGPSPWVTYPERMLKNRAWGFIFRDHFSELFSGLWTVEELRDIDPVAAARDVTPPAPAHVGQGPGEADPALAIAAEVTPPEQTMPPVDVSDPAMREPAPVEVSACKPCTHPDGFVPSQDGLDAFCPYCGETQPRAEEPEQQEFAT